MLVRDFLLTSAARTPEKVALICGDVRISYREMAARSRAVGFHLASLGVQPGDRVLICLDNSPEAVYSIFGTSLAGAVFVVVNRTATPERLAHLLNDCRAKVLITTGSRQQELRQLGRETPSVAAVLEPTDIAALPPVADAHPGPAMTDDALAGIIYTSGSMGEPKGVMVSHGNVTAAAEAVITYLENTADDIVVNVLPLSFSYGIYQLFTMMKVGGTLVLENSFAYPYLIVERIIQEKATGFPLIPFIAAKLLQMGLADFKFPHLRYVTNAAAALPVRDLLALQQCLPTTKVFSMYGVTECKRASYLAPDQVTARPASVGKGIPGQEHRIVNEQGESVGPNEVGELVVSGPHVMQGYWERPEATARVLKRDPSTGARTLFTGDLFRMDEEGYLYFVARKDDIIKTRGEKVAPREVEDVLYRLEGVQEAAVVGVPDAMLGYAIKAVVSLKTGAKLTAKDVMRHCALHLESHMVPKHVAFMDELPKTASGKILKQALTAGDA